MMGVAGKPTGCNPWASDAITKEILMTWEWLPAALFLAGFVVLWLFVFPRLKGGG
jgi:hypothetical protein